MEKFVHQSTRLYCDLLQAYRMFTIEEKMKKWLSDDISINGKNIKIVIDHNQLNINTKGSKILSKETEKKVVINWKEESKNIDSILEINFMNCSPRAVNCVEIHLLHKDLDAEYIEYYNKFWKKALDLLRYSFNKEWVIQDGDLTLTKLTGRSL